MTKPGATASRYVGEEGLDRFVSALMRLNVVVILRWWLWFLTKELEGEREETLREIRQ